MIPTLSSLASAQAGGVYRCAPLIGPASPSIAVPRLQEVDLQKARDKNAFLSAVAAALGFPAHFGHNWDAFYDCLGDVEDDHVVLLLRHASAFARGESEEFATALDTLADACDLWEEEGRSLLVVVELDAPVLAPELPEVSVPRGK